MVHSPSKGSVSLSCWYLGWAMPHARQQCKGAMVAPISPLARKATHPSFLVGSRDAAGMEADHEEEGIQQFSTGVGKDG